MQGGKYIEVGEEIGKAKACGKKCRRGQPRSANEAQGIGGKNAKTDKRDKKRRAQAYGNPRARQITQKAAEAWVQTCCRGAQAQKTAERRAQMCPPLCGIFRFFIMFYLLRNVFCSLRRTLFCATFLRCFIFCTTFPPFDRPGRYVLSQLFTAPHRREATPSDRTLRDNGADFRCR